MRTKRNVSVLLAIFSLTLLTISPAFADEETGNRAYVKGSEYGQLYAKCVPAESYGIKGTCRVFLVGPEQDELLQTYPWHSPDIFVEGFSADKSVYAVQVGPLTRGHQANAEDFALAFL